jgi:excisionase family DNA binding protein
MSSQSTLLSPKDLAAAIGASESSLRRWVDSGDIRISRTAGGHRRIPLAEAVQFIRKIGAVVVRPEVLNLPALHDAHGTTTQDAVNDDGRLFDALSAGDRELARGLILSWYLQGRPLHELFDGPIRGAMHRMGELWKHDERGILVEHRATDICLGVISGMRALLPAAQNSAPLALGGALAGDPYQIPTLMAATTLAEAGWRDVNFGANTPLELLAAEAAHSDARLVWLSVSAVDDAKSARAAVKRLAATLAAREVPLVIGGHASADALPRGSSGASAVRSMSELAAFARGLLSRGSISSSAPIAR